MAKRQVANLELVLTAVSSGSTFSGWHSLGVPFSLFRAWGVITSSSGTYGGSLLGHQATTAGAIPSTASTQYTVLATLDNTTQVGYNSTAIPCSYLGFLSTAGPSTGGNSVVVTVACAG